MDMKQIKELMAAMEKAGLKRVRIKEEKGSEIELERHGEYPSAPHRSEPTIHFAPSHHRPHQEEAPKDKTETSAAGNFVTSPMVGTYYSSPSPEDPPYIKVGDVVDENTVVCIIEAMKVMNEVKAGKKGKVVEILVGNADPIEFGSKLFRIV